MTGEYSLLSSRQTKKEYDIAVLVATYRSDLEKTLNTLRSIVMQKGVQAQIVVSDDGSEENHFEEITRYLLEVGFDDFTLVHSDINRGTVSNVLHALRYVGAPLVKTIAPGDYLYDSKTLSRFCGAMSKGAAFCFGRAVYYRDAGELSVANMRSPVMLDAFQRHGKTPNMKLAKRYWVAYHDGFLGAAATYRTEDLLSALAKLEGEVRFCEDFAIRILLASGCSAEYIDDWVVWYEASVGVSSTVLKKGGSQSKSERDGQLRVLMRFFPDDEDVQILARDWAIAREGSSVGVAIRRVIANPKLGVFHARRLLTRLTYRARGYDVSIYHSITMRC